ncbi:MAG TPA: long-chain fatty acid--CoA ligase [Blastocatellia bacterium]|nr:long-chain fatty acid--CoA ligase [Blastocatellia bacterium]
MKPTDPNTLVELLKTVAATRAGREVLAFRNGKQWTGLTAAELLNRVRALSAGFHEMGVRKGDCVAILAESGPLWTISDFAILSLGAVTVPIYPTQAVYQVEYILRDSAPKLLLISSSRQLKRVNEAIGHLPDLPVAIFEDTGVKGERTTLASIEQRGGEILAESPKLYDQLSTQVTGQDLASIIYTSGTTGEPKGVMLTHSNIVFNALAAGYYIGIEADNHMLSFLPLSHIFERVVVYLCIYFGVKVTYSAGIETVASDLISVRPTLMSAVPRMLEKINGRIAKNAAAESKLRKALVKWSLRVGRRRATLELTGRRPGPLLRLEWKIADKLVFARIREIFGASMKRLVSGGAALPEEIALVFNGAGIPVLQGYGLTETSPVIAVNTLEHHRLGSVGRPLPGVEVKIADDGEILTRGPHVFKGYFKKPTETEGVFERDNSGGGRWFKTGDIGRFDSDGFLYITDRKKDLIKTSAGKYVAPQLLESRLGRSEFIEQAFIVGNDRKYVSALVVPDFERLGEWAKGQGITEKERTALVTHQKVVSLFRSEVNLVTADLADFEKVKRIALLAKEFTIEGGEMTPTLKARRAVIQDKYRDLIDSLYPDGSDS